MAPNLAILSIPAYFVLTLAPHMYAASIAMKDKGPSNYDHRNPRAANYLENMRKQLAPADFARWERAEAAHHNGNENYALYAATVLASVLADTTATKTGVLGLLAGGMSAETRTFVLSYFASRILYTFVYIATSDNRKTFIRTIVYFTGVGLCFQQFVRAATILGN
ncbi:hypothetical protein ANO11243_066070 [Dothideomycetidae sp. 11243]|nr:hypothetical protein ANO11243_066070 [fungal sp. No.11243]